MTKKIHYYIDTVDFHLLDAGQVVYHPNYLVICDKARQKSIEDLGFSFQDLWKLNLALAVYKTDAKYLYPLRWETPYVVITILKEITKVKVVVHQKIVKLQDKSWLAKRSFLSEKMEISLDEVLYELDITLVCVDLKNFRTTKIPEGLAKALS